MSLNINWALLLPILARAAVFCTSIPAHESAHGLAASWLGDDTAKREGRISLNPLKHFDLVGTFALLFLGFGWARPVPVNPSLFKGNKKVGMAVTAAAGPLANLIMAFITMIIYKLVVIFAAYFGWINSFGAVTLIQVLSMMVLTNISLAVFNLFPVNPLDGSRIFGLILPDKIYFKLMQYERYLYILLILLMATGFLSVPISYLSDKVLAFMNMATSFIDILAELLI